MKYSLKSVTSLVTRYVVFAVCGFVSAFVLSSAYESVYNRSLPYVHTLDPVNLSNLSARYDLDEASQLKSAHIGQFGKPATLKLPSTDRSIRLDITSPVNDRGTWLARASSMHVLLPGKALNGNISTSILYCRASFRTVNAQSLPKPGANIFVDTDQKWRYVYKVTTARAFDTSYQFVPSEVGGKGKLLIFCNDPENGANDIIEAELLTVQGVDI